MRITKSIRASATNFPDAKNLLHGNAPVQQPETLHSLTVSTTVGGKDVPGLRDKSLSSVPVVAKAPGCLVKPLAPVDLQ